MAVRYEDSQLGVSMRYHRAKANGEHGRWVPEKIQREAYEGLETCLERLNSSESVDEIRVYGRSFDRKEGPRLLSVGAPGDDTDPALTLNNERSQPRTHDAQRFFEQDMRTVRRMTPKQDPDLEESESRDFVELAELARKTELNQDRRTSLDESMDFP